MLTGIHLHKLNLSAYAEDSRYAYAISFATLIIAAANLARYWDWSVVLQDFIFILGVPIFLLVVNCLGVFVSHATFVTLVQLAEFLLMNGSGMVTLRLLWGP